MEFKVLDKKGKLSSKTITASDATFGRDFNEALIHQLVSSYMTNGRSGTRAQLTRGEVHHTTKKPYAQKYEKEAKSSMLWKSSWDTLPKRQCNYSPGCDV